MREIYLFSLAECPVDVILQLFGQRGVAAESQPFGELCESSTDGSFPSFFLGRHEQRYHSTIPHFRDDLGPPLLNLGRVVKYLKQNRRAFTQLPWAVIAPTHHRVISPSPTLTDIFQEPEFTSAYH
jgi:hypothetical protein